jgi:uncharacterized membrane protein
LVRAMRRAHQRRGKVIDAMVDQAKQAAEQAGKQATGQAGQATETAKGVAEGAAQQAVGSLSGELRNLGREVAVEAIKVLSPVAQQAAERAAERAAQELVERAPGLVMDYGPKLVGRAGSAALGGVTGALGGVGGAVKGVAKAGASAAGAVSKLRPGRRGHRGKGATTPSGTGRGRRLPIQEWVDVGVPVEAAYAQWTQFEEFPKYMFRTERLEQKDDTHLVWHSKIGGVRRSWEAEITEQRPKERIVWKATSGVNHVGVITFHPLAHNLTRVQVNLDLQPTGLLEKTASGIRTIRRAVKSDLMRFKALIEMREKPAGEWPGRIEQGEVVQEEQAPSGEQAAEEQPTQEQPAKAEASERHAPPEGQEKPGAPTGEAAEGERPKQPEAAAATRQGSSGQGEGSSFRSGPIPDGPAAAGHQRKEKRDHDRG